MMWRGYVDKNIPFYLLVQLSTRGFLFSTAYQHLPYFPLPLCLKEGRGVSTRFIHHFLLRLQS